jgi:hypothetical protein
MEGDLSVSRFAYLAFFIAVIVGVSACGGDEPAAFEPVTSVATESDGTDADASPESTETTVATTGGGSNSADNSDSIRDVDLDARLSGLEVALNGTAEIVDDNTVRMVFDEGSVAGADPIRACVVGKSLLDEGMVLIVEYPDGEKICD